MKRQPILILILILSLALFLRIYRISALTEFLGDQGRTGLHIYEAINQRTLPQLGPTVLTGEYLGPAFYYLIGPAFILGGFDPVWPAIFMVVMGVGSVYLLWRVASAMFGWQIAALVSLVYATSPNIVRQDRIIWEPNFIPFFGLLFVFSLYQIKEKRKFGYVLLLGLALGVLVQLHYPNIFFLGLTLLFAGYLLVNQKKLKLGGIWKWGAIGFSAFLLVISPFLLYEITHNFVNLAGIARVMLLSVGTATSERSILINFIDYAGRVLGRVVPIPAPWQIWLSLMVIAGLVWQRRNFWLVFFALWFLLGIGAISLYRGVVYDHYLNFLLPVSFFFLGYLLAALRRVLPMSLLLLVVIWIVFSHLKRTDINTPGNNDIRRTRLMVQTITRAAAGQPFSFTLVASRSFSDLHYRYFLTLAQIRPQPITGSDYQRLFLVCEKEPCPSESEMREKSAVRSLCWEAHCQGEYPPVDLTHWQLAKSEEVAGGWIYSYSPR